jgi:hypothetical protein
MTQRLPARVAGVSVVALSTAAAIAQQVPPGAPAIAAASAGTRSGTPATSGTSADASPSASASGIASPVASVAMQLLAGCVPACRTGFVCTEGQCVSSCNPRCPDSLTCVDGECVAPPRMDAGFTAEDQTQFADPREVAQRREARRQRDDARARIKGAHLLLSPEAGVAVLFGIGDSSSPIFGATAGMRYYVDYRFSFDLRAGIHGGPFFRDGASVGQQLHLTFEPGVTFHEGRASGGASMLVGYNTFGGDSPGVTETGTVVYAPGAQAYVGGGVQFGVRVAGPLHLGLRFHVGAWDLRDPHPMIRGLAGATLVF